MSSLLHSDSEDSSEESFTNSLAERDLDKPTEGKVPLSTSIILKKTQIVTSQEKGPKVSIRISAIGSTKAIHPSAFNVAGTQTVATISKYLMRKLGLHTIHLYVSNSFSPTPDERIGQLFEMFNTNGVLNLSYCETVAFG